MIFQMGGGGGRGHTQGIANLSPWSRDQFPCALLDCVSKASYSPGEKDQIFKPKDA